MKILVFTDTHANYEVHEQLIQKANEVDIVLCAGDMTIFGMQLEPILEHLNQMPKPVYFIHGNHESLNDIEAILPKFKNLHLIHKKEITIKGISIIGFGGGGFDYKTPEFVEFIKNHKPPTILITHQPPHNTAVDTFDDLKPTGNKDFRVYIEKNQPAIVICGHIHETFGKQDKINESLIINPGPQGVILDVQNS